MRLFDEKAERTVWISLLMSIPVMVFVIWQETGHIGTTEILIILATLGLGIGILFLVKWYANKK